MSKVGCGYRNKIPISQHAIWAYYATETVSRVTCSFRALVFTATNVEQVESPMATGTMTTAEVAVHL